MKKIEKKTQRIKRHTRIRATLSGTKDCPRLSVFRSNFYIYAQLIDDVHSNTLVAASDQELEKKKTKLPKEAMKRAKEVGLVLAQRAKEKKIKKVVFDRSGYKYHGRVRALAEGAREGGLSF
ncbi:MAG TPA: 50S ribosomal protein L18 [Patescibacteria group bacterium]|nr:50S ribosomal protein L18 [Patescibacteria group bacterium]